MSEIGTSHIGFQCTPIIISEQVDDFKSKQAPKVVANTHTNTLKKPRSITTHDTFDTQTIRGFDFKESNLNFNN